MSQPVKHTQQFARLFVGDQPPRDFVEDPVGFQLQREGAAAGEASLIKQAQQVEQVVVAPRLSGAAENGRRSRREAGLLRR
ncbi:hypothetical protein [Nonomuraea sp. NPDC049784]|uniref:hypothetical protein n=1 Tax=Nonomuraea sp. NPDC049784 TaxID=3154361 RepID=UPI0034031BAF